MLYNKWVVFPVKIFSRIYVCDYRRGMDLWMDFLITYMHHSELQVITAPLLTATIQRSPQHLLSLFAACCVNSRSLTTASNSGDSSASRAQVLLTQPPVQNSTDYYWQLIINWIPGRRPFHTNLLVFSSQADFQLNFSAGLGSSLYSLGADSTENTTSNSPTIVAMGALPSDRLDIVSAGTCLPTVTKQRMFLLAIVA
jgi:hypothetical protein